ncbi:MoaD/ThiS family protein [Novosphingobium sp. ST904]|uniref:MoaD/ThiS family protein n=1 Tax=Novosphingobium sp. ST904 TaxID=1684385 RepID=UPI0006C8314A|nr:MoaD/ThiS family protein [Novosphingobium sp. ST904]KPH64393.1 thiamine biosynthesis protein ThiS [Novosphingobium sp. ST904]TCM37398.1 molybdopterin synthase sulfur carrier subunit [Novosphingobium sp. ST904]
MALRLVFLGRLEDAAGAASLAVPFLPTLAEVIGALEAGLADALRGSRVRVAVNGVVLSGEGQPELGEGDEIAFLPPVSGG